MCGFKSVCALFFVFCFITHKWLNTERTNKDAWYIVCMYILTFVFVRTYLDMCACLCVCVRVFRKIRQLKQYSTYVQKSNLSMSYFFCIFSLRSHILVSYSVILCLYQVRNCCIVTLYIWAENHAFFFFVRPSKNSYGWTKWELFLWLIIVVFLYLFYRFHSISFGLVSNESNYGEWWFLYSQENFICFKNGWTSFSLHLHFIQFGFCQKRSFNSYLRLLPNASDISTTNDIKIHEYHTQK